MNFISRTILIYIKKSVNDMDTIIKLLTTFSIFVGGSFKTGTLFGSNLLPQLLGRNERTIALPKMVLAIW